LRSTRALEHSQVSESPEGSKERVRQILEEELARVDSPRAAEDVLVRAERLAAGVTEQQAADAAAASPGSAAENVEQAAADAQPRDEAARVLAVAAAESVAPTSEAPAVLAGAREALGADAGPAAPPVERGRVLLEEAALRRMRRFDRLDARLYLAINRLPHPAPLQWLSNGVTEGARGGWVWVLGVVAATALGEPRGRQALTVLLPCVVGATWVAEYPIKRYFRRRRPFIDIVRALVVGKKPGSWSFPSGHTASSFAAAWTLGAVWPRRAPIFLGLASLVGFSRVYVGAHYPGDVTSGALLGMGLAEAIRRCVLLGLRRVRGR
jgi:membrane-associated phospholipid phosphatase